MNLPYSDLNPLTGLATAALIAWKTTVSRAMAMAKMPASTNIHHCISTGAMGGEELAMV